MSSPTALQATLPCLACRAILPDRRQLNRLEISTLETSFERDDLYPAFPSIASSAKAGCSLCGLIWRKLNSIPPDALKAIEDGNGEVVWIPYENRTRHLDRSWDQKVKLRASFDFLPYITSSDGPADDGGSAIQDDHQHGGAVTSMTIVYSPITGRLRLSDGVFWNGEHFDFPIFDSTDLHSPRPEWRRRLPSAITLSHDNITMMKCWIDDCLENHAGCSISHPGCSSATNWIPRRLLEVEARESEIFIRLIESSEHNLGVKNHFAALSHVWGDVNRSPPLRLLLSNISRLKSRIHEHELPKTFLDAIHVCIVLGIRYVWIDSLCIIQDSREDWREQAPLMHLVYGHALVTIVSTSATSSHHGFLERDIATVPTAKVAYVPLEVIKEDDLSQSYLVIYAPDDPLSSWRLHAINSSKWNTRAWTMQERSLSTRMIHFCHNKIFFECRGRLRSEENEPVQTSEIFNSTLWPRDPTISHEELHQHWQLVVSEYTSRSLTVNNDKLAAIESVAEEMAAVSGKKYIRFAGMWESHLRSELLWVVMMGKATRLDVWRAPSWSWAAVDGQISLWHRDFRNSQQSPPDSLLRCLSLAPFEVLEMDREYPDPRAINPGFLQVKSLVKRIDRVKKHDGSGTGRDFFPYDLIMNDLKDKNEPRSEATITFAHGRIDFEDPESSSLLAGKGIYIYLHVNDNARATGLLVRAEICQEAKGAKAYQRVAIATLFYDRSGQAIYDDVFNMSQTPERLTII